MKIKIKHGSSAIDEALKNVNGTARSFTITSWSQVLWAADEAEKMLSAMPKRDRAGTMIHFTPAGADSAAYKYESKSTQITLTRNTSGWWLTDVKTVYVYPRQRESLVVNISQNQADIISKKALSKFAIV